MRFGILSRKVTKGYRDKILQEKMDKNSQSGALDETTLSPLKKIILHDFIGDVNIFDEVFVYLSGSSSCIMPAMAEGLGKGLSLLATMRCFFFKPSEL